MIIKKFFKKIEKIVKFGDYTLGSEVDSFEKNLAKRTGAKHALGVEMELMPFF